jgi:hypothetical protein
MMMPHFSSAEFVECLPDRGANKIQITRKKSIGLVAVRSLNQKND